MDAMQLSGPLTHEQRGLVEAYLEAHPFPLAFLMHSHPRLVRAGKAAGLSEEDLNAEACLGLVRAAQKFDASRGVLFTTYGNAWARSYVGRLVETTCNRVRRLPEGTGHDEEGRAIYLDTFAGRDVWDDWERGEKRTSARAELFEALSRVHVHERALLLRRYGIECEEESYADLARESGVSREAMRQRCHNAAAKARRRSEAAGRKRERQKQAAAAGLYADVA